MTKELTLEDVVLSHVEFDGLGYNEPKENTIKCAAETLHDECIKGTNQRGPLAHRFASALQGLPTYISVPFYNAEIIDLMHALGYETNDSHELVELYWIKCGEILANHFKN
jgi:hypothetical protein